ncbi:MAG: hypothetical protein JKY89_06045, partial [Immundisolibacteraceae bacterium]|nr:hypothetical protein [Immundisolibacteraceae bacterium]
MNNNQDFLTAAKEQIRVLKGIMNKNTYSQYQRAWWSFIEYLEFECVPPVSDGLDLKRSQIEHHLNKFKMTPATYNQRLSAIFTLLYRIEGDNPRLELPSFQKWQGRNGIKTLKYTPRDKLFMDSVELEEVRSAFCDLNLDRLIRNRNLLAFDIIDELWLRVSEVALINLEDIDIKSK